MCYMVDKPVTIEADCSSCERTRTFRLDVVGLETYTCGVCGAERNAEDVLDSGSSDTTPAIRPIKRTEETDDEDDYYPVGPI